MVLDRLVHLCLMSERKSYAEGGECAHFFWKIIKLGQKEMGECVILDNLEKKNEKGECISI